MKESSEPSRDRSKVLELRPERHREDHWLVTAAIAGSQPARTEIYQRHAKHVAGVLAKLLAVHLDLRDPMQEVFLAVVRDLVSLRDSGSLKAWGLPEWGRQPSAEHPARLTAQVVAAFFSQRQGARTRGTSRCW